ncbi:dihydrofolate reductase family protein [Hymenobacter sp. B81]|uniref:dihydrofolate reductase family protein n=1 Tax=Hymenobacter sp. B81 TaxID=3344878 RepID=UPI0037DD1D99
MRKLKLQMQMTADGFVAGPNGELDWMACPWTADLEQYVTALTEPVDTIVLGRQLAEGFIPHWAAVAADPAHEEHWAGRTFTDTPKVVFSRRLTASPWPNTVLAKGDLVTEITELKSQPGQDLITYGGVSLAASLVQHGLVDELHLFVNPTAIGRGRSIFAELTAHQPLTLVQATAFDCGIVGLHYAPRRG